MSIDIMKNFVEELKWRGMIQDIMPGTEEKLMEGPIADFLRAYAASHTARFHMPGHKGHGPLGCEALDITEIQGADSLYEASGIIAQSERNAAALFGTGRTLYSTEGSSQCIHRRWGR